MRLRGGYKVGGRGYIKVESFFRKENQVESNWRIIDRYTLQGPLFLEEPLVKSIDLGCCCFRRSPQPRCRPFLGKLYVLSLAREDEKN